MSIDEENPYRGEAIGGASASVAPLIAPNFLRYFHHDKGIRFYTSATVVLIATTTAMIIGGWLLSRGAGPAKAGGVFLLVLGVVIGLPALLITPLTISIWRMYADHYRNGMLMAGVILEEDPTALAVIAEMGNGQGASYLGVRRILPDTPPADRKKGQWVPCVSVYHRGQNEEDHWVWFDPVPIYFGTGDPGVIQSLLDRLGPEPYHRLEECVRHGLVPASTKTLVLLTEDLERLDEYENPNYQKKTDERA